MKGGVKMKEKKINFWIIVGIALVAAVLSSVITASITGNVIKIEKQKLGTDIYTKLEVDEKFSLIRAHTCDGDEICEMRGKISSENPISIYSKAGIVKVTGDLTLKNEGSGAEISLIPSGNELKINAQTTRFEGYVASNSLTGIGTAYACLNEKGVFVRKSTPCK